MQRCCWEAKQKRNIIQSKTVYLESCRPSTGSQRYNTKMSILSLPSEMLVEIATYLDTTRNLANFKMTCSRIYNAVESEKVDRKRLPQLKIQCISFSENGHSQIEVDYSYENEVDCLSKKRDWDYSDPSSPRLQILIQHWSLEDSCEMDFAGHCILEIPLLESLLEINYGNEIQCQLNNGGSLKLANPGKFKEALPLVQDFFRKAQPVSLRVNWNHMPLDEALQGLKNLKRLLIYTQECRQDDCVLCELPFLTHEGLVPLVSRPNFSLSIFWKSRTNISLDGFQKIVQAWKSADLTTEQRKDTYWHLVLGPNIDGNELRTAIIRNQGEKLAENPLFNGSNHFDNEVEFRNDVHPDQTLTINLWKENKGGSD